MQDQQSGRVQTRAPYQYGTLEYNRWFAAALRAKTYTWEQAERDQADYLARSQRARAAQASGARHDDPRANRPAPRPSKQWCQAINTRVAADDRLSQGAKNCLVFIVSEIGNRGQRILCNSYLGYLMSRSPRTVQRYIAQLKKYGYIKAVELHCQRGMTTGREISVVASAVRPFWHPEVRAELAAKSITTQTLENLGTTKMSPTKGLSDLLRSNIYGERTSCAIHHLSYPQIPQQSSLWPT
jgi:hypothetical protein